MFLNNKTQKSPKRRFLLILGVIAFLSFCSLGLMIIFWDSMLSNLSKIQKIGFGSFIIIYAAVRFSRLLKREPDDV